MEEFEISQEYKDKANRKFGISLRYLRESKGFTQTDFSKFVGISRQSLVAYEKGITSPNMKIVFDIAGKLNVKIETLFSSEIAVNSMIEEAKKPLKELQEHKDQLTNKIHLIDLEIQRIHKEISDLELLK